MLARRTTARLAPAVMGATVAIVSFSGVASATPAHGSALSAAVRATDPTPAAGPSTTANKPAAGKPIPLTFGLKPKDFGGAPRGAFKFLIVPGQKANDVVSVYNLANVPLDLKVYATDGFTNGQGTFAALTLDKAAQDAGNWVSLDIPKKSVLRVPPRSRVDVPFAVNVPKDATPGDHFGAMVVSLSSEAANASGTLLDVDSRVISKIDIRVAGDVKPQLTIESLSASFAGTMNPIHSGSALVSFQVKNTGNIVQRGRIQVDLKSLAGPSPDPVIAEIPTLTPGSTIDISVPFASVWPLVRYTVTASVTPLAEVGDPVGATQSSETTFWALPLAQVGLLLLIAAIIAAVKAAMNRRRRTRPRGGRHGAVPPQSSPSDLMGASS